MAENNILLDLAEKLTAVAKVITTLAEISASGEETAIIEIPEPAVEISKPEAPAAKKLTIADVRAVFVQKKREGFADQLRRLLAKYGAANLTGIKEEDYEALKAEAEALNG